MIKSSEFKALTPIVPPPKSENDLLVIVRKNLPGKILPPNIYKPTSNTDGGLVWENMPSDHAIEFFINQCDARYKIITIDTENAYPDAQS